MPQPDAIETTLLLIGDAGAPAVEEPVLAALTAVLAETPDRSMAVFLGDIVYPRGLPGPDDPGRAEGERRLEAQLAAVRRSGARGVVVPGNHDWGQGATDGWDVVRYEHAYVTQHGPPAVVMLPAGGCPGPEVVDVGERLRLVVLDTQWWLHPHAKPLHPTSRCEADAESEILEALRAALRGAGGRHVVVAGHHALASGGEHGGHFTVLDHLFPLRHVSPWLWVPLPILGSAYPLARQAGVSRQDLSHRAYRAMRDSLVAAMEVAPPVLYVSGHEHNLQVFEGSGARWLAVSGAGYHGPKPRVVAIRGTRYAAARSGFMRVDLLRDGRVRLGVLIVAGDGEPHEALSLWLVSEAIEEAR